MSPSCFTFMQCINYCNSGSNLLIVQQRLKSGSTNSSFRDFVAMPESSQIAFCSRYCQFPYIRHLVNQKIHFPCGRRDHSAIYSRILVLVPEGSRLHVDSGTRNFETYFHVNVLKNKKQALNYAFFYSFNYSVLNWRTRTAHAATRKGLMIFLQNTVIPTRYIRNLPTVKANPQTQNLEGVCQRHMVSSCRYWSRCSLVSSSGVRSIPEICHLNLL